jgi:ketosteroid isomerase-like protein
MDVEDEVIWSAVHAANRAWFEGRAHEVGALFHPRAVGVFPAAGQRLEGREAMVRSFADYTAQVHTLSFEESEPSIDRFGDTAIVGYRFAVRYQLRAAEPSAEAAPKVLDEQGYEVLVLVRERGAWLAVWRSQVPL